MTSLYRQQQQGIDRNFSLVVEFLDRKFSRTRLYLPEVPNYFYKGDKYKLEITVYSNPKIAKIDARIINITNFDREADFESSYDLSKLSMSEFQRVIEDLVTKVDTGKIE